MLVESLILEKLDYACHNLSSLALKKAPSRTYIIIEVDWLWFDQWYSW